jgi:hypothetical protein
MGPFLLLAPLFLVPPGECSCGGGKALSGGGGPANDDVCGPRNSDEDCSMMNNFVKTSWGSRRTLAAASAF